MIQLNRMQYSGGYATPKQAKSGSQPPQLFMHTARSGIVWLNLCNRCIFWPLTNYSAPLAQEQMRFEEI